MTETAFDRIKAGLEEAIAYTKGESTSVRVHQVAIEPVDVRAVRKKLNLTQEQFAVLLGISTSGLRKWEQGQRQPTGAARTLLRIMDREPEAVARALKAA